MTVKEYNTCVDSHSDAVYRFVLHNIKDKDDARDIVQDTYEKLWMNYEGVSFEKAKSYIFTTAYRTMIDKIRRSSKMVKMEDHHTAASGHTHQYNDLKKVIREALDTIPEIQRTVIMLRDYEGYSYQEIGDITGLSESQVKVYIYRARTSLKQYIGDIENVV
jgi:RNA polymerase sigma factor (sigma-70 family)